MPREFCKLRRSIFSPTQNYNNFTKSVTETTEKHVDETRTKPWEVARNPQKYPLILAWVGPEQTYRKIIIKHII